MGRPGSFFERIRADAELRELLERFCDFQAIEDAQEAPWMSVEGIEDLEVLGHDASGGLFAIGVDHAAGTTPVFHATSEGQAGLIAGSVQELLELMVALPYWRDCLKFSGRGQLAEMRRAAPLLERELDPRARTLRERLAGSFVPDHVLEALHAHVVRGARYRIVSVEDGEPFEGLFNKFVVDDNPMWR